MPSHPLDLSTMRQQQLNSQDPSPYPGYNYNSDEQESQLPDNYYERALVNNLPESTPGVHQDGNVSSRILFFSSSHMIFDRTSTSTKYLPMKKIEWLNGSFEVAGTQVSSIRHYASLTTRPHPLEHSYTFPNQNMPIGMC